MLSLSNLYDDLSNFTNFDNDINDSMGKYILKLKTVREKNWDSYKTFWPPRLINALKNNNLTCFFGAGLSMACGLPSWDSLLRDSLGISNDFLDDDNAKNDPLTQAELASHKIGADKVQTLIRKAVKQTSKPSFNHFLLAEFKLKYYITSNYDVLFENAWDKVCDNKLIVILNDSDLYTYFENGDVNKPKDAEAHYLFKIHGCADNNKEQMILTRSDYRRHYRSNELFFKTIIKLIFLEYHTLFLGFSHKDPEITRLVEDSIWLWENKQAKNQPNFYSLQFDMSNIAPEIFAARGIVALSPPIVVSDDAIKDMRSFYLSHALVDLYAMTEDYVDIMNVSLETDLDRYSSIIIDPLSKIIEKLENCSTDAMQCIEGNNDYAWMVTLLSELSHFAGQGIYLLNENGKIVHYEIDDELKRTRAANLTASNSYAERPYFRQARTFRKPFISALYESIYNKIATFSICYPLTKGNIFKGLLFSACQIGQWKEPVEASKEIQSKKRSVILVDSNGICLLPPNQEFAYEKTKINSESRIGFLKDDLLVLSRKDRLISRIMENLIPLGKDDDVLSLSSDLKYYSIVKEIPFTRWKLAISSRIILSQE